MRSPSGIERVAQAFAVVPPVIRFLSGATVALVVLGPTYFAQAATVTYGFKLEGQDNYIFDLPSNPVPLVYGDTYFSLRSPAGLPANSYITFYTAGVAKYDGGLSVQTEPTLTWTSTSLLSAPFLANYHPGTALFTGPTSAPVFPAPSPGSYYIRYLTYGGTTFPIWDDLFVISNVASAAAGEAPSELPTFTITFNFVPGQPLVPGGPSVPGTFSMVPGNLLFQPGATYSIYLNPVETTYAVVSGTASLAGTVNAQFLPGSYTARQYDILTSAGLNGTTFGA
ncbi:MAG: hypothetical protein ACM3JD_00480, partial [Rudaea sp.]